MAKRVAEEILVVVLIFDVFLTQSEKQ